MSSLEIDIKQYTTCAPLSCGARVWLTRLLTGFVRSCLPLSAMLIPRLQISIITTDHVNYSFLTKVDSYTPRALLCEERIIIESA